MGHSRNLSPSTVGHTSHCAAVLASEYNEKLARLSLPGLTLKLLDEFATKYFPDQRLFPAALTYSATIVQVSAPRLLW